MKIRQGFVSNSSSSSFIIGVKGEGELTTKMLVDSFGITESSPLYRFGENLAKFLINNSTIYNEEGILHNYGYRTIEEMIEDGVPAAELLQKGYKVREGDASYSEGEAIELFVGNGGIPDIETEQFIFKTTY